MKYLSITFVALAMLSLSCKKDECIEKKNIQENCVCYQIAEPVCGCNGQQYTNACYAECDGVLTYTEGPCGQ